MSDIQRSVIELFCVELWREVFDYFNSNELWYSFRGLNKKINGIIDQTISHLNFEKHGSYDYFIKNIQATMNVANVRSLKLRKGSEARHFFSIYSLNSLVQLRLLSLDNMYSFNDNSFKFWNQLSSLKYLQSLKIQFWGNYGSQNSIEEKKFIIRSIFNQDFCPLLQSFVINTSDGQIWRSPISSLITTKTTNIEYISIDSLTFNDLIKLLPGLSNLKTFRPDYELFYDNEFNEQQPEMTNAIPFTLKCIRLHLKLSQSITFEHVEYLLKTPNLKDLFLWGWNHLLNAKKWELLLSVQCPKLLKLEFVCTGPICDDDFDQAADDFEQECEITPFWLERNVTITDEDFSGHDYRSDIVVRFNIEKSKQSIGLN